MRSLKGACARAQGGKCCRVGRGRRVGREGEQRSTLLPTWALHSLLAVLVLMRPPFPPPPAHHHHHHRPPSLRPSSSSAPFSFALRLFQPRVPHNIPKTKKHTRSIRTQGLHAVAIRTKDSVPRFLPLLSGSSSFFLFFFICLSYRFLNLFLISLSLSFFLTLCPFL
jgi:hypothetical protein